MSNPTNTIFNRCLRFISLFTFQNEDGDYWLWKLEILTIYESIRIISKVCVSNTGDTDWHAIADIQGSWMHTAFYIESYNTYK
jgi:hypothetical protein